MRSPKATIFWCRLVVAVAATIALLISESALASSGQGGMSVDQYRRMFPPAPQNVRIELRDGKATISWDAPPAPPPGRIGYDPEVGAYNVYVVQENLERRRLGQTRSMTFRDPEIPGPGARRRYAVTAVQRSGVESGMSEVVGLQLRKEN
jgi:fibronectin type 3 domain-containing protein